MDDLGGRLHFTKMQGAGNSFLICWENIPLVSRAKTTKGLCDPNFGIGADGMVFLNAEKNGSFEWDFYNSDGSPAEFCGNAARCVALSIFEKDLKTKKINIKTMAGEVLCEVKNQHLVQVQMPKVEWLSKSLLVPMWPNPVAWLNTGVPHLVVEVQSVEELKSYPSEAALMRSWVGLGSGGANVTFLFMHSAQKISAVTFERGVENFTLACGTGAVAAAHFMMEKNKTSDCQVLMPGGQLDVVSTGGNVLMTGEAYKIADLTVPSEIFKKDPS